MKKNHLHLGKILGIPIGIDYSWFLIFFLLSWVLASTYYPAEYKSWNQIEYWIAGWFKNSSRVVQCHTRLVPNYIEPH